MQANGFETPLPSEAEFSAIHDAGQAQVVWRKYINDTDTPVSAYLKMVGEQKNAFLLESVEGGETLGRYSIIGMHPDLIWRARGDAVEVKQSTDPDAPFKPDPRIFLDSLKALIDESRIDLPEHVQRALPPMFAGVFGYFGYDTVNRLERLPENTSNGLDFYDAIFIRPMIIAVFDNIQHEITFVTPVRPDKSVQAKQAYIAAVDRINKVIDGLVSNPAPQHRTTESTSGNQFASNMTPAEYGGIVDRAKEYIRAGDIFQVVLSQRFSAPFNASPFQLYRALRRFNPSPFLFYLNFDDCTLVGSSPEILVRVRDNKVTIRPIAGTRWRGETPEEDALLEADLLADPKELAEHLMLLDLGRNDVGRAAQLGSVEVTQEFEVERYSHVMHIVSNVVGDLAKDMDAVDALMAGFPAGTVSGAPKIRAMEIIAELEKDQRGPYAGCIGYFSAEGSVDTCIALRTAAIKDGIMHVQAGAGIVADSDPEEENKECLNKAGALMKAANFALSG